MRSSVAPGPNPVHAIVPHPARSRRWTTPARESSSGSSRRRHDPCGAEVRRSAARRRSRKGSTRHPRGTCHRPTGTIARIAAAIAAVSWDAPATARHHDDQPWVASVGIQSRTADRRDTRGMQQIADGGGLRPERTDHRRHVGRIVRHLLRELDRLRVVSFDVQPHHLGDDRQISAIDRLLERELYAEERGRPPSAPSRGRTCRAGTRSSRAPGRERRRLSGPPVHAAARVATRATRAAAVEGRRLMSVRVATHTGTLRRVGSLGPRRDGGTGRRAGLKIPWASAREGSTPSPGTQTTRPSTTRSPRSNRSSPSDEMSTVRASPSTTSSAMSLPTTGACWNP